MTVVSEITPNRMRIVPVYSEKLHHSVKGDKESSAGIMDPMKANAVVRLNQSMRS